MKTFLYNMSAVLLGHLQMGMHLRPRHYQIKLDLVKAFLGPWVAGCNLSAVAPPPVSVSSYHLSLWSSTAIFLQPRPVSTSTQSC